MVVEKPRDHRKNVLKNFSRMQPERGAWVFCTGLTKGGGENGFKFYLNPDCVAVYIEVFVYTSIYKHVYVHLYICVSTYLYVYKNIRAD